MRCFFFLLLFPGLLYSHKVVVQNHTLDTLSIVNYHYVDFIEQKGVEHVCRPHKSITLSFETSELFALLCFKNQKFASSFYTAFDYCRVPIFITVEQSLKGLQLKISNDPYVSGWTLFQNAISSYKNRLSEKHNSYFDSKVEYVAFFEQYQNFFPENSLYDQFSKIELQLLSDRVKGISFHDSKLSSVVKKQLSNNYTNLCKTPILNDWIFQFVMNYMLSITQSPKQEISNVYQKCCRDLLANLEILGVYKEHQEKLVQAINESTGYRIHQ